MKLPENVSFETGAATLLTYAMTYHALVDRASLRAGETLLVLGAAGGVGTSAVALGALLGARVIAAASTDEKTAYCREHGAAEVICYGREDLKARAKALTNGAGADVIYDPVGGAFSEAALRSIAWEGRFLVVGFASGEIPKIPLNLALLKGCQIVGVFWGSFAMCHPERNRANAAKIFEWVSQGKLRPHVDAVLPFERASEALVRMGNRAVMGKLVLEPCARAGEEVAARRQSHAPRSARLDMHASHFTGEATVGARWTRACARRKPCHPRACLRVAHSKCCSCPRRARWAVEPPTRGRTIAWPRWRASSAQAHVRRASASRRTARDRASACSTPPGRRRSCPARRRWSSSRSSGRCG